jgi:hypothetical protein
MDPLSVAGLALGAYPVLSHAFSQYKQGAEHCHNWRRFRTQFEAFSRKVDAECYFFENVIRDLLFEPPAPFPLRGISEEKVLESMRDQNNAIWQSTELKRTIRLRLDDRYDWFLATIQEIWETQNELCRQLQISETVGRSTAEKLLPADSKQLKADAYTPQWWEFQWKRIKETLWIEQRDKKIEKLHSLTEYIQRTLEIRDKRLRAGGATSLSTFPKQVERVQQSACSLYSALFKAWACSCPLAHTTLLRLDHCESPSRTSMGENTLFDVVFIVPVEYGVSCDPSGKKTTSQKAKEQPQIRQAVEVKVFESQQGISPQPLQPVVHVNQPSASISSSKNNSIRNATASPHTHSLKQSLKDHLSLRYFSTDLRSALSISVWRITKVA